MQEPHTAREHELISEPLASGASPRRGVVAGLERLRGLRKMLILDLAGPLIAYDVLRSHDVSQVLALILAGVLPAIGVLVDIVRSRTLDVIGSFVLGGLLLGAFLGLVTHSPRAVLLEGSIVTGAFALAALASLAARRPLMFYFAQATMGGQHSTAGQELDRRHKSVDGVGRYFRLVTLVWGVAFAIEAAGKVIVIETASTGTALTFTRIAPYALVAILLPWTMARGRATRASRAPAAPA